MKKITIHLKYIATCMVSLVVLVGLTGCESNATGNEVDLTVFRDNERKFAFHYPKQWKIVESTYADTRFKIVSKNGRGPEDCGVNVKFEKNATGMSISDFVKNVSPAMSKEILRVIKNKSQDAEIMESGFTYLSNQNAYYHVIFSTQRTVDYVAKVAMYSVQTMKDGYIYTVACRCKQSDFKQQFPEFKNIMTGFILLN